MSSPNSPQQTAPATPPVIPAQASGPPSPPRPPQPPSDTEGGGTPPRRPGGAANIVGVVGEVLITVGMVVLLFVFYEVYVTDLLSAGKQKDVTSALDDDWKDPGQQRQEHFDVANGQGFAKMFIPKFGADYKFTVLKGTDEKTLEAGPGHYVDTALPGENGNFSVAGHRVGKGAPFNDLDQLSSCDAIIIESNTTWYVYRVVPYEGEAQGWDAGKGKTAACKDVKVPGSLNPAYKNVVGQQIVTPDRVDVKSPVPNNPTSTLTKEGQLKMLTLTTCHPPFSAEKRLIAHAMMVKSYPKADGFRPPEMKES
ncbi:class E sortase [Pseudonocardiaceae bacterium YIM PH 21723]|nr:class E sortase [Pseudonocardiaceae bacterium YIM PH 21723]